MDATRRLHLEGAQREALTARRQRLEEVPIGERLLEAIAWSAVLLADDLRRAGQRPERALPIGLGNRTS
jgi:hypothetical protein